MSLLTKNAVPSELFRGCVFSERFRSNGEIAKNGGVITGALEYKNGGAYFDGTNDLITYPSGYQPFNSGFWSVVIEFTPAFEANDNAGHCFFDTMGTARTILQKMSENSLIVYAGNTTLVMDCALADYQAYWKTNQRNTLVVTCRSGSNTMWLNGVQIKTSTTAWTALSTLNIKIGADQGNGQKFAGTLHSVKFFKHYRAVNLMTVQEAKDYHSNSNFNYEKRATCILPMTADCHDATNNRTLDVSGKGNHFILGDGSTGSTFPTKLQRRGYSFDGGDYMTNPSNLVNTSSFTICMLLKSRESDSNYVFGIPPNPTNYFAYIHVSHALAVEGGGNLATYGDGLAILPIKTPIGAYVFATAVIRNSSNVSIINLGMRSTALGNKFVGDMNYFALFPFELTPLQVADLYLKLKNKINLI